MEGGVLLNKLCTNSWKPTFFWSWCRSRSKKRPAPQHWTALENITASLPDNVRVKPHGISGKRPWQIAAINGRRKACWRPCWPEWRSVWPGPLPEPHSSLSGQRVWRHQPAPGPGDSIHHSHTAQAATKHRLHLKVRNPNWKKEKRGILEKWKFL